MVKVGCKACRISKVKCDLAHCASRVCTRCARLGLACIENPPSRQGRPRIPDTTKRLSPAVRALLIKPPRRDADASGDALQPHEANGAQAVGVSPAVPQPGVQPGALTPFAWAPADGGGGELVSAGDRTVSGICSTWELFCRQMADVASKPLKLEIVRRAFAIARQAQNWALTSEVMEVARALKLSMDDAVLAMAHAATAAANQPAGEPVMPDYIREWDGHLGVPAVTTVQWYGRHALLPNVAFRAFWAQAHDGDMTRLDAISGFNPAGDPRVADRAWLQMIDTVAMQREMTAAFVRMLSQVRPDTPTAQHLEGTLDCTMRMRLGSGRFSTYTQPRLRMYVSDSGLVCLHCCAWPGLTVAGTRQELAPPAPVLAIALAPYPDITLAPYPSRQPPCLPCVANADACGPAEVSLPRSNSASNSADAHRVEANSLSGATSPPQSGAPSAPPGAQPSGAEAPAVSEQLPPLHAPPLHASPFPAVVQASAMPAYATVNAFPLHGFPVSRAWPQPVAAFPAEATGLHASPRAPSADADFAQLADSMNLPLTIEQLLELCSGDL